MIGLTLDQKTTENFRRALEKKNETVRKAGERAITKTAILLESRVTEKIADESTDTGQLLQSVYWKSSGLEGEVGATAAHAPYIEFGTKPHWPPFRPIYEWVWRKRHDLGIPDEAVFPYAKAVVEKIAAFGTKERKPFTRSIEETETDFNQIVESELAGALRK